MISIEKEPRKLKLHKTSLNLFRKFLEPLQTKHPLERMKYSRASLEKTRPILSNLHKKSSYSDKSPGLKVDSPTKILNLPKLPFGTHSPYNNCPNFIQAHFVKNEKDASESQIVEIKQIEKSQRMKRKLTMTRHVSPLSPRSPRTSLNSPKTQELAGSGGKIVIECSDSGYQCYLAQKIKYARQVCSVSPQNNSPRLSVGKILPFIIL